ncbi:hypothetical protein ACFX15_011888 [Malus domestica]
MFDRDGAALIWKKRWLWFDDSNTTDRKPEEPGTRYAGTGNGLEPNKPVEPAGGEIGSDEQSSNPAVEDSVGRGAAVWGAVG